VEAPASLESYYRQIMTDGFFHADPHPGNLLWWNDKIYFLDFAWWASWAQRSGSCSC